MGGSRTLHIFAQGVKTLAALSSQIVGARALLHRDKGTGFSPPRVAQPLNDVPSTLCVEIKAVKVRFPFDRVRAQQWNSDRRARVLSPVAQAHANVACLEVAIVCHYFCGCIIALPVTHHQLRSRRDDFSCFIRPQFL